ncbi:MAG TPA: hypothetical protein P5050_08690 [Bacteroidia bacterium]|nr:hypothetical protein [Sphingobacteriales bacterium]HPD65533.1 hypothetical protein [Bacteroidia bacterium]HRS59282.1 hypothetical protein [Bacteroidia bacterium]HRU67128.1 hypothetical protein [Bacteroidia bacterium]
MRNDPFLRVLLQGFAFLILAALVMLPLHFFTELEVEWKISTITLFLHVVLSPLFSYRYADKKEYFFYSFIASIALFFDLSILAALVAWQPWPFISYHLRFMLISLSFFFVSWGVFYLMKKVGGR